MFPPLFDYEPQKLDERRRLVELERLAAAARGHTGTLTERLWTDASAALASLAERWQRTAPAAACCASSMEGAERP